MEVVFLLFFFLFFGGGGGGGGTLVLLIKISWKKTKTYLLCFISIHLHQIVGNLLYYRYINSAIVAPDAFDIVNIGAEKALTSDQRRNLGSIAKILQFAASNKGVSIVCLG